MANSNSYQLLQAMIKNSLQCFICSVTAFGDSLVPFLSFSHSDAKQLCFPPYTFNARGEKRETNAATVRWAAKIRGELRNVSRRLSESISPYRIEACLLAKLLITARRSAFSVLGSRLGHSPATPTRYFGAHRRDWTWKPESTSRTMAIAENEGRRALHANGQV